MNQKPNCVIFGGAFDPFHNGHLYMLEQLINHVEVEQIHIIPNYLNHFKEKPLFSSEERLSMLNKIKNILPQNKQQPRYIISDIELKKKEACYSIDTITTFQKDYPDHRLLLLIGSDNFFSFHRWKKFHEILKKVTLCVIRRDDYTLDKYQSYIDTTLHQKDFTSLMLIGKQSCLLYTSPSPRDS